MQFTFYAVLILVTLSAIVIVHEYGHLRSARRNGVSVNDFSIGFGPTLKQWTTKRGLRVNWKLIPFGGSVAPLGMTPDIVEEEGLDPEGTFAYKHPWVRFRVAMSGVVYNIILAIVAETIAVACVAPPETLKDLLYLPAVVFWSSIAIIGSLLSLLLKAPFNGFSDVHSVIQAPSGFADSVADGQSAGVPVIAVFFIVVMLMSFFMAVFNSLPLYPLDGFMAVLAIVDLARKVAKRDNHEYQPLKMKNIRIWTSVGQALFIGVIAYIYLRDIFEILI